MTQLEDRFPLLKELPRLPLVSKTPAVPMPLLSEMTGTELWVKRDDLTSARYGGNKVRKLEYLLGEAKNRGAKAVLTTGAFGSHHVLATAIHGAASGFAVHAVVAPQPRTEHVARNLRADLAAGATLHPVARVSAVPFEMRRVERVLRHEGLRPFVIPHGGSTPLGALGYVEAGLELAEQVDAGELPEPEVIYVALGSGGTAAGISIGLAAAGLTTRVVAVRVTGRLIANRFTVRSLVRGAMKLLRERDPRFPAVGELALRHLEIHAQSPSEGYGVSTPATRKALELAAAEGLTADETYTARAIETMMRAAEEQRFKRGLYWHTLSSADLGLLLARAPVPPRFLERYTPKASGWRHGS
ncbi:MAG: pyridoxal-phosphate dependent enzyme [Polyangiaceae bacterium]|nr:pyridoxal-phosphate dependent enzyme [Polyangiaceae bacterium]